MDNSERNFLLTAAWLFARHGRGDRARILCEALVEDDPVNGVSAVALAELLLADREPERALETLETASVPAALDRAEALLEARALSMLGRNDEAKRRWRRHCEAAKGGARKWI